MRSLIAIAKWPMSYPWVNLSGQASDWVNLKLGKYLMESPAAAAQIQGDRGRVLPGSCPAGQLPAESHCGLASAALSEYSPHSLQLRISLLTKICDHALLHIFLEQREASDVLVPDVRARHTWPGS
eukprot:360979-Chlamydomonas_euryale.AAC.7